MQFIAEEVRELMAQLGFATMAEMIGHVEMLDTRQAVRHWKASGLDISPILAVPQNRYNQTLHQSVAQDHGLDVALDQQLIAQAQTAIIDAVPVAFAMQIRNVNRTVGTMLGNAVTKVWGGAGLPDDTIKIHFRGSAGQSFGAFVPAGIELRLEGDGNDYVGKGLSGGRLIVHPDRRATFVAEDNVVAGNVIGYGATAGELFLRGVVGERFCVRNSGATAVVEGIGDHGCEYMTGGRVVVLGRTGRNFAAGMSGGIAYVYDPDETFAKLVNYEMVELEPLEDDDIAVVLELVQRHRDLTESTVAARIVDDWATSQSVFRKVMPRDYKRVLGVMRDAQAEGLTEEQTNSRVMESV
jgi:glutamate synthase (NADPH/NADH) large chain